MIPWTKSVTGWTHHPKVLELASEPQVAQSNGDDTLDPVASRLVAIGLVAVLRDFTAANAPDGILTPKHLRRFGAVIGWSEEWCRKIVESMVEVEILDRLDDGSIRVHGWAELHEEVVLILERRKRDRERKAEARLASLSVQHSADSPRSVRRHSEDVSKVSAEVPRRDGDGDGDGEEQVHEPVGLTADATSPEAQPPKPKATRRRPNPEANPAVVRLIAAYATAYESRHGEKPVIDGGKLGSLLKRRLRTVTEPDLEDLIRAGLASTAPFFDGGLAAILSDIGLEKLRAEQRRSHGGNGASADPAYQRDLAAHGQEIATFLAGERKRGRA